MKMFKNSVKLFIAIIISINIALYLMRHDHRFAAMMQRTLQEFFRMTYNGDLACEFEDITLFTPAITVKNIVVTPLDGSSAWSWQAKKAQISFSWLEVIRTGRIAIRVNVYNQTMFSAVKQGRVMIEEHIQRLFVLPNIPVPAFLKELKIHGCVLTLIDHARSLQATVHLHADMKRIGPAFKVGLYPTQGDMRGQTTYADALSGSLQLAINDTVGAGTPLKVVCSLAFRLPHLEQQTCFLTGSWSGERGFFTMHSSDRSLLVDHITIDRGRLSFLLTTPLSHIQPLLPIGTDEPIQGLCTMQADSRLDDIPGSLRATIDVRDCCYKNYTIPHAHVDFQADGEKFLGTMHLELGKELSLSGTYHGSRQSGVSFVLTNDTATDITRFWSLGSHGLALTGQVTRQGDVQASYQATLLHAVVDKKVQSAGTVSTKGQQIFAQGVLGKDSYKLNGALNTRILKYFTYRSKNGAQASLCATDTKNNYHGSIDYALVKSFLPDSLKAELVGQGSIEATMHYDEGELKGAIALRDGTIRVPKLYNFINDLQASVSVYLQEKKVVITDLVCGLHRGRITSKRATLSFNDYGTPSFIHIPILLDSCFISWQKDLFALVCGGLLFSSRSDTSRSESLRDESLPRLQGTLFIDRSQLKGNLLSNDMQRSLLLQTPIPQKSFDIELDLHVLTREPLRVKTSFLDARALFDFFIKKNATAPEVTGKVDVVQGELKFPYKPLSITGGVMHFLPQQLYDPFIELTAKNKIKKYTVTLYVTGSVQNPHIHFESSPTLREEQIVTLLLAGSHDSSLNILMPALIMQNMQQVIFGPARPSSKLHSYFKSLLRPLAHVRLVPSFADETGRGGLRAAVEIEVNDQLSAVIEKNFSLSEDTKFEVNYALSDDVSVRGIKDERGDFGAEMEVKWKF